MKTKAAVLFGAVVLAFLAAACSNPAVEAPQTGTGRILVNIGIEGAESLEPAESRNAAAGPARTVVPDGFNLSTFTKFEADFTATGGGTTQTGVVLIGGTNNISLEVGTYTVTITAFTGSDPYTAAAVGSQTGVAITLGGTTPVNILLGPKTGGGQGTFSYSVNVGTAIDNGSLAVKTRAGGDVEGGTKTLAGSTNNTDSISLDPGYYQVLLNLTKSGQGAGYPEIIHIYTGLTSSLSASFADADFAALAAVTDVDLSGKFAKPVTGQEPAASLDGDQYTGDISWNPAVSTVFAENQIYTAEVTLAAKPGYTFDGVGADAFSYTGATSVSNDANSGTVTVIFPETQDNEGTAGAGYGVDDGVIAVTAEPANLTITQETLTNLVLTVPEGYTVTGWYVDGTIAAALGTGPSVSLDPDDYAAKTHRVSVFATKAGRPYSWTAVFTVEAAGSVTLLDKAQFIAALQSMDTNTVDTPLTLALDPAVNLADADLNTALAPANMTNKYVIVDLSAYSFTTIIGDFDATDFNEVFAEQSVVGIIFPDTLTTIGEYAVANMSGGNSGLRSVTIPASVTSIGEGAFGGCYFLTRVTFEGATAITMASDAFVGDLKTVYAAGGAGTYTKSDNNWTKQ